MLHQRINEHRVSRLTTHLVWATKYRYPVLEGDIQIRCCSLLIQICEAIEIQILKGVVLKDHILLHIAYRSSQNLSNIVTLLQGCTSRKLQIEFSVLKQRYCGTSLLGDSFWLLEYRKHY